MLSLSKTLYSSLEHILASTQPAGDLLVPVTASNGGLSLSSGLPKRSSAPATAAIDWLSGWRPSYTNLLLNAVSRIFFNGKVKVLPGLANSFALASAPFRLIISDFKQLNLRGHSPHLTPSHRGASVMTAGPRYTVQLQSGPHREHSFHQLLYSWMCLGRYRATAIVHRAIT
jgi:hypothetical protein